MATKRKSKSRDRRNRMHRNDGREFSVPIMRRYWDIWIACYATGERAKEIRDELHMVLHRAGGRDATRKITNEWALGGSMRQIQMPLEPKRLRRMLERLDDLCASGLLEIRIHGEHFN